jgi:molecular chaperone HtpG
VHKFQINLRGMIELLSDHLYSQPQVFIRELLQNGTDAIRARQKLEPEFNGEITFELSERGESRTLLATDNGVGLTEDEVHRFLATIGESSKRAARGEQQQDYLGQFGIGLLSCFVVSDEIVVISRSAKPGNPAVEWHGFPDGTYTIKTLDADLEPGTQVYLTARTEHRELFTAKRLKETVQHYGKYLPYPISIRNQSRSTVLNDIVPPWRMEFASAGERRKELLQYGKECFGEKFLDAIPLHSRDGAVDGVAFVLPHPQSLNSQRTHRVYLRNMFLAERADNLLPEWAFFVKVVINASDLRPTASRESFYEDAKLEKARDALGSQLRSYLRDLAEEQPKRFEQLLHVHDVSMKALALEDDDFFQILIEWIPLETTQGEMRLKDLRDLPQIQYISRTDQYRQVSRIAAAQGNCVINAGYIYLTDLLDKYQELNPDAPLVKIEPTDLVESFTELTDDEAARIDRLLMLAREVLLPWDCNVESRHFQPVDIPAMYCVDEEGTFFRSIKQTQEISAPLWSDLLGKLSARESTKFRAELCLNYKNQLVQQLLLIEEPDVLRRAIEIFYIQALLLGQHPLSNKELKLLNNSLLEWVRWGVGLYQQQKGKQ